MLRGKFELEHLEPTRDPLSTELNSGKFTVSVSIVIFQQNYFPNIFIFCRISFLNFKKYVIK